MALAKKEGRGHLKIFLGAAPGVGKTYAMLAAARAEKAGGRDVVAGLVETHGRQETQALLDGLESLPRKPIVYQNRVLHEFDLDAALARRPSLLLVDEYAHTNIPGSRHPKRWQDIDELLAAGIDVWTTLNIQHLESLNDVIQKITRVRVRETVPDRAFEKADDIVLVDLPAGRAVEAVGRRQDLHPGHGGARGREFLQAAESAAHCASLHCGARRNGSMPISSSGCRRRRSKDRGRPASASSPASVPIRSHP